MPQLLDQYGKEIVREDKSRELALIAKRLRKAQQVNGSYDAARSNPDMDKYWANADAFDADSANSPAVRGKLVRNSRYEVANNGISDGIAQTYATDLVGVGPSLRMQTKSAGYNQLVERTWSLWCAAIKFRRKFWTMAHAKHVDGEALSIMRVNPKVKHPIKLDIALRETEQCHTPFPPYGDPTYIDGIKLDEFDNPLWYDFLTSHPGNASGSFTLKPNRVPANRILHWFKMRRPGQHRGVPECASTLNLGAAFRRLREATLSTAEKVAAWTLFMETVGEPDEDDAQFNVPLSTLEIVHGMMTALPNGAKPHQLQAEQPGPTYDTFYKSLANEQGRPKNMPLNKILCNSADYNYASGRLDHQTYHGSLDDDRLDGNDLVLEPLFEVWYDFAIAFYGWLGGNPEAVGIGGRWHVWDWPKHRVADVKTEADANRTRLESGQVFIHHLFSDAGMDFEDECEAAANAFGKTVEELKGRLFDVIFPPPKSLAPKRAVAQDPAVSAVLARMLNGVNGNGAHHGN